MTSTLSAQEKPLSKIFNDDYVFSVPPYQRPYAWTTDHAKELFDDLFEFMDGNTLEIENLPPYFLGSIVLIKKDDPNSDIVDGQQRLTTLTILLAAIRDRLSGNSDHTSELTKLIYEKGSKILNTKDRFRLTPRDRDSEFFQEYIQKEDGLSRLQNLRSQLSDSQAKIKLNAILFKEKLENIADEDCVRFAQFIITRCYIVIVSTPDIDSAFRIFSVLNSRGLNLSPTDLLKSQIIGGIQDSERAAYTKKWEDLEEGLGREAFRDLFSHIRMIHKKSKLKGTLYKEFTENIDMKDSKIFGSSWICVKPPLLTAKATFVVPRGLWKHFQLAAVK